MLLFPFTTAVAITVTYTSDTFIITNIVTNTAITTTPIPTNTRVSITATAVKISFTL